MLYHRARILDAAGNFGESEMHLREALADPTLLEPHARLHAGLFNASADNGPRSARPGTGLAGDTGRRGASCCVSGRAE
jgi:hypothetical protein